jgi:TolA-binding protein
MNRHNLLFALALLWSPAAVAADASDRIEASERLTGNVPEEFQAWKATEKRFIDRMSELESDTSRYIAHREAEERQRVSDSYDALIATLQDLEIGRRTQAVEVFEEFLRVYPDAEYASHVRFRLAELYFEVQKEKWLAVMEEYSVVEKRCTVDGDEAACDELTEQPKVDLSPAIALYHRIIEDNRDLPREEQYEFLDGAYYMLGFSHTDPSSAQLDDDLARESFEELIRVRPDSDLADAAHLFLGNSAFERSRKEDLASAIAHYQSVFDKGPEGKYYGEAMYQLAWAYYKMALEPAEYDRALDMFTQVLEHSEEEFRESGRPSDYRPDAIKYMAISIYDVAEKQGVSPVEAARAYFAKGEPRVYEWDVYSALGDVLTQLARQEEAIDLYTYLQNDPRWVNRPENPDFQWMIAKLYMQGAFPDVVASNLARVELTERYGDGSPWWEANRNNPKALAKAREYIETSLADVAIEYNLKAAETGNLDDYKKSIETFREFLDKFPMSDDYYKQQWYLALTLQQAAELAEGDESLAYYREAVSELDRLMKSRRHHAYGDGAVYRNFLIRMAIAQAVYGDFKNRPESAEIERSYPRLDNKKDEAGNPIQIDVYKVVPEHEALIAAIDQVLKWRFKKPEEGGDDYAAAIEENRVALMYIGGQILYYYNRYDEARPRLKALIVNPDGSKSKYRATENASFAAGLLVDSYLNEGDLAQVRFWTTEFIRNPVGPPPKKGAPDQGLIFAKTLEGTAFKQCLQFVEVEDRASAGECFLQYLKDFPNSEYANLALFNAANSMEIIGKAEQAIQLFEQYVNKYPNDPNSEALYFRIATTYESTFNLEEAIRYYDLLVKLFPKNIDAPNAYYNGAFLRIGIGDNAGAARAFERYAELFPDRDDVESTYWEAGEQWEAVGRSQAKSFYERYLAKFKGQNLDHAFEAKYKLATYALEEKNTRVYNAKLDEILADFRSVAEGPNASRLGPRARHYAAQAAFREVQARYDILIKDQLTGNEEKDVKLLMETKAPEIKEFNALAEKIILYGDAEYALASIYLMGAAQMYFANLGFSLKCPTKFSPDECDVFMEIVETQIHPAFFPVQDKAVELLKQVISTAKEKKQHFIWVDKAQQALNDLNPVDFPALKPELRGGTDASIFPAIKPLPMPDPSQVTAIPGQEGGVPGGAP